MDSTMTAILQRFFDNVNHSSDKWVPYFEIYERHLNMYRGKPVNLIEVGVQKGGSLEMWSDYFGGSANITGIDIDPECTNLKYDANNINVVIGDQGSGEFWDQFLSSYNKPIDIFIDDGGHTMDQQILTFEKVFAKMPIGSIYICEDCHTSYMPHNGGGYGVKSSFINYAKGYIDVIHENWINELDTALEHKKKIGKDLTSVFFYDSMTVFEKFGKKEMTRVFPTKFR
jgi:cephalosporin hydroxylase